ncbi:hypothetical protein NDS46_15675 [Paenibacillus thiaminolyticus]|uniref:hypothetical protein n=1 Tax=Paenibacillus thiaminolyticus TaxID=49283 RepID=UPI00232C0930|nr:hypothetical protein [Paenibacillus thiaminolyticus]WCF05832.1 hypothetical protein NDS46_15675 [Paenibacillus thiaminolyticus]
MLFIIRRLKAGGRCSKITEVNIFVRGRDKDTKEGSAGTGGMYKTMVLSLPYDKLEHIASIEEMKKEVRE